MVLQGKISLISGASRGIGRAIALSLAEAGSDVAVNFVSNAEAAEAVVERIKSMGRRAVAYQADVSDGAKVTAMLDRVRKDLGPIQILVNNAGITRDRSFLKLTAENWSEVLHINLSGPFHLTSQTLPGMIELGWGRIINIASIVGQMGNFGQVNYSVTKGGLIAFTKSLAREVARKGITVNAVSPGYIETDMTATVPEKALEAVCQATPVGRLGKPEEVATAVRFLACPSTSYITGQVIAVNGGMYM